MKAVKERKMGGKSVPGGTLETLKSSKVCLNLVSLVADSASSLVADRVLSWSGARASRD